MRLIDADALMADCQLAQKQADRHGREFANAFHSGGGEISTEWWCVEDMIENAPTIEERKTGKWLRYGEDGNPNEEDTTYWQCDQCLEIERGRRVRPMNFCPNCGARMEGDT